MKKPVVKKTVSRQPDVWDYVSAHANDNVSGFVTEALRAHRRTQLRRDMITGYKAMSADPRLLEDLELWDTTLNDGLDEDGKTQ